LNLLSFVISNQSRKQSCQYVNTRIRHESWSKRCPTFFKPWWFWTVSRPSLQVTGKGSGGFSLCNGAPGSIRGRMVWSTCSRRYHNYDSRARVTVTVCLEANDRVVSSDKVKVPVYLNKLDYLLDCDELPNPEVHRRITLALCTRHLCKVFHETSRLICWARFCRTLQEKMRSWIRSGDTSFVIMGYWMASGKFMLCAIFWLFWQFPGHDIINTKCILKVRKYKTFKVQLLCKNKFFCGGAEESFITT
jgi:hypothetical protein